MNIRHRLSRIPKTLLAILTATWGAISAQPIAAQSLTTIYHFPAASGQNPGGYASNSAGAHPQSGVIVSGNKFYGTADTGGGAGWGTVFTLNTDGTGFAVLHCFSATSVGPSGYFTNYDGTHPGGLILSSNTLYGTTEEGGHYGFGTVFAIKTDGTGFTNLHHFTSGSDGANPQAGVILSGNTLYGTTIGQSSLGAAGIAYGTVFALKIDGTGFTNLHNFSAPHPISGTNSDGIAPSGRLVLLGNVLYGAASRGGFFSYGTVFALNTDGTGFTNLHHFSGSNGGFPGSMILPSNTLYGVGGGGSGSSGTVFKLDTDGTGFGVLHHFAQWSLSSDGVTNSDGVSPNSLVLLGDTLYGTASYGGHWTRGTVFAVNTDGTGFTNLHMFTALPNFFPSGVSSNLDGAHPGSGLVSGGNILYGTASSGGSAGRGTVFSIPFPPQLRIAHSGPNVIVTWPTSYAGFDYTGFTLERATNLVSPVWVTYPGAPVVVNGQNTVTNLIFGTQQLYRLRQ